MYLSHPLMVIDPCAKYGMPKSKLTEVTVGHEVMTKSYKFDLEIKGKHWVGNMNVHHLLMVKNSCAKFGKHPMLNHKIVIGRTQKHVKYPINFTLWSTFKVVSGSWMFATHRLMVIQPCEKYRKKIGRIQRFETNYNWDLHRWFKRQK